MADRHWVRVLPAGSLCPQKAPEEVRGFGEAGTGDAGPSDGTPLVEVNSFTIGYQVAPEAMAGSRIAYDLPGPRSSDEDVLAEFLARPEVVDLFLDDVDLSDE